MMTKSIQTSTTLASDITYLRGKYPELIVLSDADKKGMIVLSPKYQGKVFTSATRGEHSPSLGWVNLAHQLP